QSCGTFHSDADSCSLMHQWKKHQRQNEMSHMIDCKLHLQTRFIQLPLRGDESGIIQENIQAAVLPADFISSSAYGVSIGKVAQNHVEVPWKFTFQLLQRFSSSFPVSHKHHHMI